MPDYGPTPKIRRINPMPRIKRAPTNPKVTSQEILEDAVMGRLIYNAGNIAGKQAAMIAWNYGLRDIEKLKYVRNFAQDEARSDTLRLLEEMRGSREGLPNVTITAERPEEVRDERILNMNLRQLMKDNI